MMITITKTEFNRIFGDYKCKESLWAYFQDNYRKARQMRIVKIENKQGKPRYRFCWECSRKLQGNHYAEITLEDGSTVIMHKACAKKCEIGRSVYYANEED